VRRPFAALSLALLAACAGPRPESPPEAAVTPPSGWRTAPTTPAAEVSVTWWEAFDDPVLTGVVETALANNVEIALAVERVAEARGQFHLARARTLPDVVGTAGGGRDKDINPGFGVPEYQNTYGGEISISYDLDLFGRLADASDAARATLLSTEAAHDNVRLAVAATAASGYITLRALDARLAVLRATLATRAGSLRVIRRRAEAGYSSQLDLAQAEADFQAAAELIPVSELAIAHQEDGLSVLLGTNPRAIERGVELDQLALPTVPAAMPSALLRRRPDIIAAEERVIAADHSLDSARAAFMPDVQLSASRGLVGSSLLAVANPQWIFALGGSLLAPIMDSGRLQAQQETVAAQRNQAAFAYRKAALTAFQEVEDRLASVQRLNEEEATLVAERDVLSRTLRLATDRYRAGYSPYLDQLDAERQLLSVQLALVRSRADRLNALVGLYQALGGGWLEANETEKLGTASQDPEGIANRALH
jgi:multidrug efflux system outer membrane protein